ncbi:segregation/condensation protein A [Candidatus Woesearchaeota archaeon]|nr:segregation/condensation protein A [Candidatus Woesearchaeota archaeon]
MHQEIYNMLIQRDEITWQSILMDLIKSEQMSPWDIDVSQLAKMYLKKVKEMKEANLHISGKIILASAMLLRIKSNKLANEEVYNFDSMLFKEDDTYEELEDLFDSAPDPSKGSFRPQLTIKTPMPRKRKVTLNDLVSALNKALEIEKRRTIRNQLNQIVNVKIPEKKVDISQLIKDVYDKIVTLFQTKEKLKFSALVNSEKKEDKIMTFIPVLHLANQEKITINQEQEFGEIDIEMYRQS